MNPIESFIELKFFSPFDIDKIPTRVLETVQENTTGCKFTSSQLVTLREFLLIIIDDLELKNEIRKELIKLHNE